MKIQMEVRQYHHLGYVSVGTNLLIGTGLEDHIQTYWSAAGQLLQLDIVMFSSFYFCYLCYLCEIHVIVVIILFLLSTTDNHYAWFHLRIKG